MLKTTTQLAAEFRSDVFDTGTLDDGGVVRDLLWSDEDVLRYINSACAQLASDTLALRRRFVIEVAAQTPTVRFPFDEILDDLQVSFVIPGLGRRRVLTKFDLDEGVYVDDYGSQYLTVPDYDAIGQPTHYSRDFDNVSMRLWKVPYMAGTLDAYAIALPATLFEGMPLPFSAQRDFDLLLLWMKHLAYAKQDADTLDLTRSNDFKAQYGPMALDRRYEIDRLRRNHAVVKPS